jgi:hypothetical protein
MSLRLGNWLSDHCFDEELIAPIRTSFDQDGTVLTWVDDLLRPEKLQGLLQAAQDHYEWRRVHRLRGASSATSREIYLATPLEDRIYEMELSDGLKPGHQMDPSVLLHILLQKLVGSDAWCDWLNRLTGDTVRHTTRRWLMRNQWDSYGSAHSDQGDDRILCMVLFLGEAWRPDCGGHLRFLESTLGPVDIEPQANRLVLFRPTPQGQHYVMPVTDQNWVRYRYSWWHHDTESA